MLSRCPARRFWIGFRMCKGTYTRHTVLGGTNCHLTQNAYSSHSRWPRSGQSRVLSLHIIHCNSSLSIKSASRFHCFRVSMPVTRQHVQRGLSSRRASLPTLLPSRTNRHIHTHTRCTVTARLYCLLVLSFLH